MRLTCHGSPYLEHILEELGGVRQGVQHVRQEAGQRVPDQSELEQLRAIVRLVCNWPLIEKYGGVLVLPQHCPLPRCISCCERPVPEVVPPVAVAGYDGARVVCDCPVALAAPDVVVVGRCLLADCCAACFLQVVEQQMGFA